MTKTIARILLIMIATMLVMCLLSCNAEKRCQSHLQKAKQGGCLTERIDTLVQYDTILGFTTEKVFIGDTIKDIDTFYQDTGGIHVRTIVKWKERTVQQRAGKDTTIIKKEYYKVTRTEYQYVDKLPWWAYLVFIGAGISIIGLSIALARKS